MTPSLPAAPLRPLRDPKGSRGALPLGPAALGTGPGLEPAWRAEARPPDGTPFAPLGRVGAPRPSRHLPPHLPPRLSDSTGAQGALPLRRVSPGRAADVWNCVTRRGEGGGTRRGGPRAPLRAAARAQRGAVRGQAGGASRDLPTHWGSLSSAGVWGRLGWPRSRGHSFLFSANAPKGRWKDGKMVWDCTRHLKICLC